MNPQERLNALHDLARQLIDTAFEQGRKSVLDDNSSLIEVKK